MTVNLQLYRRQEKMGYIIFPIIIFLLICLFVGLAGGLLYLIYLPFKKRFLKSGVLTKIRGRQINKIYVLVLLVIALSQTYFAFFPKDSFYFDEFKSNTGIELPSSAHIISKSSDYPDIHGDYSAVAVIKLDTIDFKKLEINLFKLADIKVDTSSQKIGRTEQYLGVAKNIKESQIEIVFTNFKKEWFKVAFLNDKQTIILERNST